jgi:PAS domain S-box-containing protein
MGFLTAMMGLMIIRQTLTLLTSMESMSISIVGHNTELPGLAVSIMAFMAVFFLERFITKRKQAEAHIYHLQGVLEAIRNINQLIVHENDQQKLLQKACEILNKTRSYELAWIGLIEEGTKNVLPTAQAGFEEDYLKSTRITWDNSETGKGPTGTAIKTKKPIVMRDIAKDSGYKPWKKQAMKRDYASSAAIPLIYEDKTFGALNVYATIPDSFNDEEINLLVEVSQDIAFALYTIEIEKEHKLAEKELHEQKDTNLKLAVIAKERDELQEWADTFDTFVGKLDKNGNTFFTNEPPLQAGGLTKEEIFGHYFPDIKWWSHSEEERAKIIECLEKAKKGIASRIETSFRSSDGTPVPIIFNSQPVMDDKGNVKYITTEGKIIIEEMELRKALREEKNTLEKKVKERTSELMTINKKLRKEIAGRKKAVEEKEDISIFNDSLIESLNEISYDHYVQDNKIFWKGAVTKMLGYSFNEMGNNKEGWLEKIHPTDRIIVEENLETAQKEKRLFDLEYRLKHKNGSYLWVHNRGKLNFNKKDELIRIIGVIMDINERKIAEDEEISSVIRVKDTERKRIANEIHDSLGQTLTVASLNLDMIKADLTDLGYEKVKQLNEALMLINSAIDESRKIAHNLMPKALEDFGLISTIEHLVVKFKEATKIDIVFYHNNIKERFDKGIELNLFRITQEALNNIIKHSNAKKVNIQLIKHTDYLIFMIEDDGIGFDVNNAKSKKDSFGLKSIQHRVTGIGGKLNIDTRKNKGTSITIEVNL